MDDEEAEVRTKLALDIERYQRDASISTPTVAANAATTTPTTDAKNKTLDLTVDEIVSPIASGKIKLLEFIEALGPTISTKDPLVRSKSVRLLSLTLGRLAIDATLLDGEIAHLFQFLLARIEDHHLVAPAALLGLRALTASTRLPVEDGLSLLRAIFEHLDVQSLAQIDRFSVYVIFRNLLANHLRAIQTRMGPNFVHGFIQTMDGEKDPRNLVICFQLSEKISQTFSLSTFAEDAFEVVACYFPIDFNPPKSDPFGITREMLVEGLRKAMTASPLFAQYCLPLIVEKLSSDLSSAKLDALKTLSVGCAIFGAKGLREQLQLLVADLRREMFAATSDAIQQGVEESATAIAKTVSDDRFCNEFPELLPHFTALVLKECGSFLNEPQNRLMYSASRLLLAFCKGSLFVTVRAIQTCFPPLHQQFMINPQLNSRCPIVEVVGQFLTALCDHVSPLPNLIESQRGLPLQDESHKSSPSLALSDITIEEVPPRSVVSPDEFSSSLQTPPPLPLTFQPPPPFFGFDEESGELVDIRHPVSEILDTCLVGEASERLCLLGLSASECWLRLPKAVGDESSRSQIVAPLVSLAVFHASLPVRTRAIRAIRKLAFIPIKTQQHHHAAGEENIFDLQVLPLLIGHLTDAVSQVGIEPMDVDNATNRARPLAVNIGHLSSLLSESCVTPQGFALATDKLLTAIETQGASSSSSSSSTSGASLGLILLECLDTLAEKGMDSSPLNGRVLKDKVLPRVKSIFIDDWDSTDWLREAEVVARGAALMRKVVEIMNQEEATAEWNETKGLLGCHLFESSSSSSSPSRRGLFPLLLSIGASLPRGCQLQASDPDFVDDLIRLAASKALEAAPTAGAAALVSGAGTLGSGAAALATGAAQLVAAIVNKADNDAALTALLDKISVAVEGRTIDDEKDGKKDVCLNGVRLWMWVTKALVIRSHRLSKQFTSKLVSWLRVGEGGVSEEVASLVSGQAFVTILADSDEVFSVRQHAVTRKMFKQRFFLQTIPVLIDKESAPTTVGEDEDEDEEEEKRANRKKSEQHRLNALASMLPHLPQQALLSELPSILPVLVKSLGGEDAVLHKSVIGCLQLLLLESPIALASHADTVIPKLLSISQQSGSMEVRCESLRCLGAMIGSSSESVSGLAPSLLMPHKQNVVKELAKCLDDKKRLVRKGAVVTRNKWYLI